jgi:Ser/Thr protein kinase RdoA (MazF antagonist)
VTAAAGRLHQLIALDSTPPRISRLDAERVAHDLFGLRGGVEALKGERDCNFRVSDTTGTYVLKFIDPAASDCVVSGQSAVLRHLALQSCSVALPRIIPTRNGSDVGVASTMHGTWRVRLVTWLPGTLLLGLRPDPPLLHRIGCRIGELDQALRTFTHPALTQAIAWDVRQLPALATLLPEVECRGVRDLLRACLPDILTLLPALSGLRSQAVHGDCHPGNVLVDEGRAECAGVIDLGDLIHGPVILEIAVTLAESLVDGVATEDNLQQLLAGFAQSQVLGENDCSVLYDLLLARLAVSLLIQTWRSRSAERLAAAPAAGSPAAGSPAAGSSAGPAPPGPESREVRAMEQLMQRGRSWWSNRFLHARAGATDEQH